MPEIEVKLTPKALFGHVLVIIGVIIILYAVFQASITFTTIMKFIDKLMPSPTITVWREQFQATEMPGFIETLGWFFMLIIELLGGFFIASIGIRVAKK